MTVKWWNGDHEPPIRCPRCKKRFRFRAFVNYFLEYPDWIFWGKNREIICQGTDGQTNYGFVHFSVDKVERLAIIDSEQEILDEQKFKQLGFDFK